MATQLTRARVEDLVRKSLGITDLSDTRRLIESLSRRYPELGAKERSLSLGVLGGTPALVAPVRARPVTDRMVEKIRAWLAADRSAVARDEDLRERREEFEGLGDKVMDEFDEGIEAARVADDAAKTTRVHIACSKLADIALTLRLASVEYACEGRCTLRRFASSIDKAVTQILQTAGETLLAAAEGLVGVAAGHVVELTEYANQAVNALTALIQGTEDNGAGDIAALATLRQNLRSARRDSLRYYLDPSVLADVLRNVISSVESRGDSLARRRQRATVQTEVNDLEGLKNRMGDQLPTSVGGTVVATTTAEDVAAYTPSFLALFNAIGAFLNEYWTGTSPSRLIYFATARSVDTSELGTAEQDIWKLLDTVIRERDALRSEIENAIVGAGVLTGNDLAAANLLDQGLGALDRLVIGMAEGSTAPDTESIQARFLEEWLVLATELAFSSTGSGGSGATTASAWTTTGGVAVPAGFDLDGQIDATETWPNSTDAVWDFDAPPAEPVGAALDSTTLGALIGSTAATAPRPSLEATFSAIYLDITT